MPHQIKESDWKTMRRLHPVALERYCERVLAEIERAAQDKARSFHQRYLDTYEIVKRRDREMGRIFDDPKRSNALSMLAHLRSNDLLTDEEFLTLSPESRRSIELLLGID